MFDPEKFMSAAVDPMATQFEVCPEGEFPFIIDSDPKQLTPENIKGVSDRTGKPYDFWQISLVCWCMDDAVRQKLGREKLSCRMRLNLDIDPTTGGLAVGPDKNISLGRLRDALGQNKPGWTPANLLGAGPFIGLVKHTKNDKGTFADITRVGKVT